MSDIVTYMFDGGGARVTNGPVGWGWAAFHPRRGEVACGCGSLPGPSTNNIAEYTALIMAATHALSKEWPVDTTFTFEGVSKLVVMQVLGEWQVKAPHLLEYRNEARRLLQPLTYELRHIYREQNARADMLATQGRDNHGKRRIKPMARR